MRLPAIVARLLGSAPPPAAQTAVPGPAPPPVLAPVPRYPPFVEGLPASPIEALLETQRELIVALRDALGMTVDDYERFVLPVVRRYSAFVHHLPASETHHHRGAGGLLRHGLEVAYNAGRAATNVAFAADKDPSLRYILAPRWRVAAGIAGLVHDIGKPASSLTVSDRAEARIWSPSIEPLADWLAREGVEQYFIRWRHGRGTHHEDFGPLMLRHNLTPEAERWLDRDPAILHAVIAVAGGRDSRSPLGELVKQADSASVERDLKENRYDPNALSLGVPVDRYLIDGMRHLVRQGLWTCNERGSRLWHLPDGLYLVWPESADDVRDLLAEDNVPGIPRSAETIAEVLVDRGHVQTWDDPRTGRARIHRRMAPLPLVRAGKPQHLDMILLASPALLYPGEPPAPVGVWEESTANTRSSAGQPTPKSTHRSSAGRAGAAAASAAQPGSQPTRSTATLTPGLPPQDTAPWDDAPPPEDPSDCGYDPADDADLSLGLDMHPVPAAAPAAQAADTSHADPDADPKPASVDPADPVPARRTQTAANPTSPRPSTGALARQPSGNPKASTGPSAARSRPALAPARPTATPTAAPVPPPRPSATAPEPATAPTSPASASTADPSPSPADAARAWLHGRGEAGRLLLELVRRHAEATASGTAGPAIALHEGAVCLAWPSALDGVAGTPQAAVEALFAANWIAINPRTPYVRTRELAGRHVILLNAAASARLTALLPALPALGAAPPKPQPKRPATAPSVSTDAASEPIHLPPPSLDRESPPASTAQPGMAPTRPQPPSAATSAADAAAAAKPSSPKALALALRERIADGSVPSTPAADGPGRMVTRRALNAYAFAGGTEPRFVLHHLGRLPGMQWSGDADVLLVLPLPDPDE